MQTSLLIDSIVRQTTVLIAQLATSGGVRAPLAHVASQVFIDLAREIEAQGVSRKVGADMFGMALRTYQRKTQRLRESATMRGRSLWEAVLEYLQNEEVVTRAAVLTRFRQDDQVLVRGVLRDLTEGGFVFASGSGEGTAFRAARAEELAKLRDTDDASAFDALLWSIIYRQGPLDRAQLCVIATVSNDALDKALSRLRAQGRIEELERGGVTHYQSRELFIPLDATVGWEAAVYDHFQALVRTIGVKLGLAADAKEHALVGGSTNETRNLIACVLLSCALFACAKSTVAENSSETHFLASCEDRCDGGLDCICGVCTEACELGSSCTYLTTAARCVANESASCDPVPTCDVECERDADCAALDDRVCEAGRCREILMSVSDGGSDAGGDAGEPMANPHAPGIPEGCRAEALADLFADDITHCPEISPGETAAARDCIRAAIQDQRPFLQFQAERGTDSLVGGGHLGVPTRDGMQLYEIDYDSLGIAYDSFGIQPLWWWPCADYRIGESDEDLVVCERVTSLECSCGFDSEEPATTSVRCKHPDPPPCDEGSCDFGGVCYPLGTSTEDDCCHCDEDGGSCIEPEWCPGWTSIGDSCETSVDCSTLSGDYKGLVCRTDLLGRDNVCTRLCNYGCPTGTECVDVPTTDGVNVDSLCMRPSE